MKLSRGKFLGRPLTLFCPDFPLWNREPGPWSSHPAPWASKAHMQSATIVLTVTSRGTWARLSVWDAIRRRLGWVSSLASRRDAVGYVGNFLSGWCIYGALDLVFNNKQIFPATGWRGKMPILPNFCGGRGCPTSLRTSCPLVLSCHTDTAPPGWADWSLAITDMEYWYSHWQFLPLQRGSFPLLFCLSWPQRGAQPPWPATPEPGGGWVLGVMLWDSGEIHQAAFAPARSRESPDPDFSGFVQHRQLHAGPRGGWKGLVCGGFIAFHHFAGLIPSRAWSLTVDFFLPKTLRKDPFSFCWLFLFLW